MSTYFKATRPDGTDFYSGTILYEPGRRVRPARASRRQICGPGYLHASDVPSETLVGGRWPCRLFEVAGRPSAGFDANHPHKGGFKQLIVLREIEAWRALGPNGQQVAALIDRAAKLTPNEARALGAARGAARAAAWAAAGAAAGAAAWAAARAAAWVAAVVAARVAAVDAARVAAWAAAVVAAWDAAGALVVRDVLAPEHFDALYGPWRSAIGELA